MFFRNVTIRIPKVSLLDTVLQMVQNRNHSFSVPLWKWQSPDYSQQILFIQFSYFGSSLRKVGFGEFLEDFNSLKDQKNILLHFQSSFIFYIFISDAFQKQSSLDATLLMLWQRIIRWNGSYKNFMQVPHHCNIRHCWW